MSDEEIRLEIFRQTAIDHVRNWNLTGEPMGVALLVNCGHSEEEALDLLEIADETERQRVLQAMRWGLENPRWEPTPEEVDQAWRGIKIDRPDIFREYAPSRYRRGQRRHRGDVTRPR